MKPILYSSYQSSCSWRVRAGFALKGIEYENKDVNLDSGDGGQQFSPEFKKLNPFCQVPALVIDDNQVIIESIAILEYIDEVYTSGTPLLPKDPILRAKARAIAQTVVSGIQPLQNDSAVEKIDEIRNKDSNLINEPNTWSQYWISLKFEGLEQLLSETSGECCVGDSITVADLCLVPQVFNAIKKGIDVNQFPIIARINAHLLTLDVFKDTNPYTKPAC